MIAYGWTLEQLEESARYVSNLLIAEGGVGVDVRYPEIKSYYCKRGNCTISFTLRFDGSTRRRKDGTYPAGSAYKTHHGRKLLPTQPVPTAEVIDIRKALLTRQRGREYIDVEQTRSTSSLCWHSFGHFMAKLFELNPGGKLRTGANIYDGREGFRNNAGHNKLVDSHDCDCYDNDLASFFDIREEK